MRIARFSSGFALLLVMWTLVILSTIALTLAASVGTEVKGSQDSWDNLQAERLSKAGHEMASYLDTRALGTTVEDLTNLPVEPLIAGLKYRITFDIGTVEVVLEGENGKMDLASTSEDEAAAFLSAWTGDPIRSREIAASIADWMDPNDESRFFGAESPWYIGRGYPARNGGLGAADLFLIKGTKPEDFGPAIISMDGTPVVRSPITRAIASLPSGRSINPNYAPPAVLRSLPEMTQDILARILEARQRSIFIGPQDFQNRLGLPADAPLLNRFTFARGTAPAVLALVQLHNSTRIMTERRVRTQTIDRRRGVPVRFVSLIEYGVPVQ